MADRGDEESDLLILFFRLITPTSPFTKKTQIMNRGYGYNDKVVTK